MATGREDENVNLAVTKTLVAQYTKRDAMLYALGIGCCSDGSDRDNYDRELRFVYEHHPKFEPFPIFLLALPFVAEEQQSGDEMLSRGPRLGFGIRPFPPDYVANYLEDGTTCGPLPKEFFKNRTDIKEVQNLPMLHISQSLILHGEIKLSEKQVDQGIMIDPSIRILLETEIVSVKPRSLGTFITSETKYYQDGNCIATAEMVALILGLDPEMIVPWKAPLKNNRCSSRKISEPAQSQSYANAAQEADKDKHKQKTVLQCNIQSNAALLYRLSGDYNSIHVVEDNLLLGPDDDHSGKVQKKRGAVLHGLCTMGHAVRAILHHLDKHHHFDKSGEEGEKSEDVKLASVRCNFVQPVFVGDVLHVEVWEEEDDFISRVKNSFEVNFRVYRGRIPYLSGMAEKQRESENKHSNVVVDSGKAQFCLRRHRTNVVRTISRL